MNCKLIPGLKRKHIELNNEIEIKSTKENNSNSSNHNSQGSLIKTNSISKSNDYKDNSKLFKSGSTLNSSKHIFHKKNELTEKNQNINNNKEKLFCKYELHKRELLLNEVAKEHINFVKQTISKYFKSDVNGKVIKNQKQKITKPLINKFNLKWKQMHNNTNHINKYNSNHISNSHTNNDLNKDFYIKQYLHKINISQYFSLTSLINVYIITFDILYMLFTVLKESRKDNKNYFIYEVIFKDILIHLMKSCILKGDEYLLTYEYDDMFNIVIKNNDTLYMNGISAQIDKLNSLLFNYNNVIKDINYQMIMKFFEVSFDLEIGNVVIEDNWVIKNCLINNGFYMNKTNLIHKVIKDKEKDNIYIKGNEIIKRRIQIREIQNMKNNIEVCMFKSIANFSVYYSNTASLISLYLYDNDVN